MSDIKPALTEREWAGRIADAAWEQDGKVYVESDCGGFPYAEDVEIERHGMAALCLHGQEFGFTRDMLAIVDGSNLSEWSTEKFLRIKRALATNIEALLPPESEESRVVK